MNKLWLLSIIIIISLAIASVYLIYHKPIDSFISSVGFKSGTSGTQSQQQSISTTSTSSTTSTTSTSSSTLPTTTISNTTTINTTTTTIPQSDNLSEANQTILDNLISNQSPTGLLVSNLTVPKPNLSVQSMNYSQALADLNNFTQVQTVSIFSPRLGKRQLMNVNPSIFLNITNITEQIPYGTTLKQTDGFQYLPNDSLYYLGINNHTGQINFYNLTVVKNQSYICINLTSNLFNQDICNAGTYRLNSPAVIGGHFGLHGNTSVQITAKLSSSLIGSQQVPFKALITNGNQTLVSFNNYTTNSLSVTNTFTYYAGENLNITLDGLGNSNYTAEDPSVTAPTNVLYYLPITFENQNSVAVSTNTPLAIGVNAVKFNYGNVIGFNALAYQTYLSPTLNNVEFFYANGTIIPSWLEGNYLNEQTANTAATSTSSVNALINSANILYWVDVNSIGFLPANTGTPTTNTIYLGWLGNVISPSNTAFSSVTGEAPQLSCNQPWNTVTGCAAGQYGQYDNGANVFTYYTNFAGTTIPSGWVAQLAPPNYVVNNALFIGAAGGTDAINSGNILFPANGADTDTLSVLPSGGGGGGAFEYGLGKPSGGTWWTGAGGYTEIWYGASSGIWVLPSGTELTFTTQPSLMGLQTVSWGKSGLISYSNNYVSNTALTDSNVAYSTANVVGFRTGSGMAWTSQWERIRIQTPNDILPSTTYGAVTPASTYTPPTTPTLTLSNTLIDQGQSILFTANIVSTQGTAPFTYNYQVTNSISNVLNCKSCFITGNSYTSNSWLWTPSSKSYIHQTTMFQGKCGYNRCTSNNS
jgi:hypothetical protein